MWSAANWPTWTSGPTSRRASRHSAPRRVRVARRRRGCDHLMVLPLDLHERSVVDRFDRAAWPPPGSRTRLPTRSLIQSPAGCSPVDTHSLAVPLLSRFAPRAGLVLVRQTFVRRSHQARSCWLWPSVRRKPRNRDRSHESHMVFRACLSRCVLAGQMARRRCNSARAASVAATPAASSWRTPPSRPRASSWFSVGILEPRLPPSRWSWRYHCFRSFQHGAGNVVVTNDALHHREHLI